MMLSGCVGDGTAVAAIVELLDSWVGNAVVVRPGPVVLLVV